MNSGSQIWSRENSPQPKSNLAIHRRTASELNSTGAFFIPFVRERGNTGRLLPSLSISRLPTPKNPHLSLSPSKTSKAVFHRTLEPTKPRLIRDRFQSPAVGTYNPDSSHRILTRQPSIQYQKNESVKKPFSRITDDLDFDAIFQRLGKHVSAVDIGKTVIRGKDEIEEEKALLAPSIQLPDHLRKYKGFYASSGWKQVDHPDEILESPEELRNTAKNTLAKLREKERNVYAKFMLL